MRKYLRISFKAFCKRACYKSANLCSRLKNCRNYRASPNRLRFHEKPFKRYIRQSIISSILSNDSTTDSSFRTETKNEMSFFHIKSSTTISQSFQDGKPILLVQFVFKTLSSHKSSNLEFQMLNHLRGNMNSRSSF